MQFLIENFSPKEVYRKYELASAVTNFSDTTRNSAILSFFKILPIKIFHDSFVNSDRAGGIT